MEETKLRKSVSSTFKLYGFSLRGDACSFLVTQLLPIGDTEREQWLEKLAEFFQKQSLTNPFIDKNDVETAIQECLKGGTDDTETIFNVIDAFHVPKFTYNQERKKFMKVEDVESNLGLFAPCNAKALLFKNRYTILHQRTARHELFTPAIVGVDSVQKFKLRPVEYLLSSSGKVDDVIVLGLLTQLKESRYYLEDPSGIVQIDLSEAKYHTGLHCENCFVLAEGWYEDKLFHVQGIGFPPPEVSKTSRAYFGNVNTFGGSSKVTLKNSSKLQRIEKENDDAMIVFLADVWLDHPKVLDKLKELFTGYSECPPEAFVLMGNFLSSQYGHTHAQVLKGKLKLLADLILQYPEIVKRSRFVFVPGSADPASPIILPRPAIPQFVCEDFLKKLPTAIFTSNPCRIQYCTQEIVVIREDLLAKLCRNTIHFPTSGEIPDHFAKTLLCQAHLSPLPLLVCPVYWALDHALYLYPLPDLIVTGDKFSPFTTNYMDCIVTNTGSFVKSEFSFKVYVPAVRQVEDSQISSTT